MKFKNLTTLILIIFIIVLINVLFWYWFNHDNKQKVNDLANWQEQRVDNLTFMLPNGFNQQTSMAGFYWFDTNDDSLAVLFEKLERDNSLILQEQIKQMVVDVDNCKDKDFNSDLKIYQHCDYNDDVYSFAILEKNNQLNVLSINEKNLKDNDVDLIIKSVNY